MTVMAPRKAGWTSRRWPRRTPRDPEGDGRPAPRVHAFQARSGLPARLQGDSVSAFVRFSTGLFQAAVSTDALIAEINAALVTATVVSSRSTPSSIRRQRHLPPSRGGGHARPRRGGPEETQAKEYDLAYIALDGNIGCMVNGAGLAMARWTSSSSRAERRRTSSTRRRRRREEVTEAFKIILQDPAVSGAREHLPAHHEVRRDRNGGVPRRAAGPVHAARGSSPGHERSWATRFCQERARHHRRGRSVTLPKVVAAVRSIKA